LVRENRHPVIGKLLVGSIKFCAGDADRIIRCRTRVVVNTEIISDMAQRQVSSPDAEISLKILRDVQR
jgi:hypothetical protein